MKAANVRQESICGCRSVRLGAAVIAAFVFISLTVLFAPSYHAAGTVEVASADEFINALVSGDADTIVINSDRAPIIELDQAYTVSRALSVNGRGAVLSLTEDGTLNVKSGCTLSIENVTISGEDEYAIVSDGMVAFGQSVVISGNYGVLVRSGGGVTSNAATVSVAESVKRAVAVNTAGGNIGISNLTLEQATGSANMIYVHPSYGTLRLGDKVRIVAADGNAVMCPAGGECPDITVNESSQLHISAPGASNTTGSGGAAIDIRSGGISFGKNASAVIYGSTGGILAASASLGEGSEVRISCSRRGSSGESGSSDAALWTGGAITMAQGSKIDMFDDPLPNNGIYAGEGFAAADNCTVRICGNGGQHSAICTPKAVTLSDGCTLNIRSVGTGVICDGGMTTGKKCTLSMLDCANYGIYAIGTLQVEKLWFGDENSIEINAGKSAVYTRESVDISRGSVVNLSAGNRAPALWVDAETDSQGHLSINASQVTVRCSASAQAVHNSGVYIVGAITLDDGSVLDVSNNGDFGVISSHGDINVSTDSKLYTSGGCGIYLLSGNLRLTEGGGLYAEGTVDSGARIEHGVLNAGEKTALDIQGARFGVEVLGEGGVWLNAVRFFDIRSTVDRAVYIQSGSLNISGVPKLSAWQKGGIDGNTRLWWTQDVSGMNSWEIIDTLDESQRMYADHTMLDPNGLQQYTDGAAVGAGGFAWYNAEWNADSYSRLGMYTSRPNARSNSFFIPAGKSFSWYLHGESYNGEDISFEVTSAGEGCFELSDDGRFTYSAPGSAVGMQDFEFIVKDSDGVSSAPAKLSINVTMSKPPIVCGTTLATPAGKQLLGQLEMYDYDGIINETEVSVKPEHGELLVYSDGQFSYTPKKGFTGIDSFAYYATDNYGDKSNTGFVTIVVGEVEDIVAPYDTMITDADTPVSLRLAPFEKEDEMEISDSDAPAEALMTEEEQQTQVTYTYEITRYPEYGTLTFTAVDTVEYVPYEEFSGSDTFRYVIRCSDGRTSNEALITVATIPSQRPSVTSASYSCVTGSKRSGKLIADDIDGNVVGFTLLSDVTKGKLTLNNSTGEFTYEAPFGFTGETSFIFTATDDDGLTSHEGVVLIRTVNIFEYLRDTGKYKTVIVCGACIIISLIVIIVLLISRAATKRKEKKLEQEKLRLLGKTEGTPESTTDDFDYYSTFGGDNSDPYR